MGFRTLDEPMRTELAGVLPNDTEMAELEQTLPHRPTKATIDLERRFVAAVEAGSLTDEHLFKVLLKSL